MAKRDLYPPIHPGEILRDEFMVPYGLSINQIARDLHVPVTRMSAIVNGQRGISADTAFRLSLYFGTTPQVWMNLQTNYELKLAEQDTSIRERIRRYVPPSEAQGPRRHSR